MTKLAQGLANGAGHSTNGSSGNINTEPSAADATTVVVIADNPRTRDRISAALSEYGVKQSTALSNPDAAADLAVDDSTIIVFTCDVDVPRELANLRRLRRDVRETAVVAISPPATGTGVRRALDAGADAMVFGPDFEDTLVTTIRAVASGQSVVPRKLRASVERPVLSHREQEVLGLLREGMTNAEIAGALFLAESTIKSHLSSIFTKFGVRSRREAVAVSLDLEPAPQAIEPLPSPSEWAPA
jgi:DNA-binding NarL/FixJ family response regulator